MILPDMTIVVAAVNRLVRRAMCMEMNVEVVQLSKVHAVKRRKPSLQVKIVAEINIAMD